MNSADEDLCSYYILYEACQMSILHDDSIQFNSIEFEDWSDSRVHKVPPICMLGIVYNNFQQPDPSCLAPFKYSFKDLVSRYTCPFLSTPLGFTSLFCKSRNSNVGKNSEENCLLSLKV